MNCRKKLSRIVHSLAALALVSAGLGIPAQAASTPRTAGHLEPSVGLLATQPAAPTTPAGHSAIEADTIWSIETVDGAAGVGNYSSLGIDSLDHLHVSYYDMPNTALKYAQWAGSGWTSETVDNSASVGQYTSLDLDGSDHPHISYYDLSNSALKYAYWDSSTWISDTLDNSASVGVDTSLAYCHLDNDVHISYYDETHTALKHARLTGTSWITRTVDSEPNVGEDSSLALRGTSPRISYRNATSETLKYAVYVAASDTWHVEALTGLGGGGESTSMAVDSSGYEHISYFSGTSEEVRYIYQDAGGWHDGLVEAINGEFAPTSLVLDGADRPHIAYVNGDGMLRYASHDGQAWQIETVDDSGEVAGDTVSLALDGDGYPHITYWATGGLLHAWLHPAPDLVVTDIWNDGGQIRYQVRNVGSAGAAAGHQVSLSIDSVGSGSDTVPVELGPGERYSGAITAWSCSGTSDTLRVTADRGGIVAELDETNNARQEIWNCDTVAPQITWGPEATVVGTDSATIEWGTDENSDSWVYYDEKASGYSGTEFDEAGVTAHQVNLTGLSPATVYRYMVESNDPSGNRVTSDEYFFETAALPTVPLTGTITFARNSGAYPAYDVIVTISETTSLDQGRGAQPAMQTVFYLDDVELGSAYTPMRTSGKTVYRYTLSPSKLGFSRTNWFVGLGEQPHEVEAQVWTTIGGYTALVAPFGPIPELPPVDVTLTKPYNNCVFYADESGTLPPGKIVQLAAVAMQYEWECEWVGSGHTDPYAERPELPDLDCGDMAQPVEEVRFYVDSQLVHTASSPTTEFTYIYDWDAGGLPVGTHTAEAVAVVSGGLEYNTQVHSFIVEEEDPTLEVDRTVTRQGNYFEVELTLSVDTWAASGVYLDYLWDYAYELMPVPKLSSLNYEVSFEYPAWLGSGDRLAKITVDFFSGSGDTLYLAPGDSLVVRYNLLPILYEDGQADPRIGTLDTRVYYTISNTSVHTEWALPWQSLPSVQDALNASDYILVTNPTRLHDLYVEDEVHDLLGTMAHLARVRNGVLGFLETYVGTYANADSDDILQVLTRPGGYWAESLNPVFQNTLDGYMLIVGETEVVPAWDTHDFDICWSIPNDWAHCRVGDNDVFHHDQWYSSTSGNGKPELVVGRVIGNSAWQLELPLLSSIGVHEGWGGYHYQAPGNALLVSGRGRGVTSFEANVDVIGLTLDDNSGADDWAVDVLHLPDTGGDVALQNGLTNGISLLHLMGHGSIDSWGGGDTVASALVTSNPPNLYNYRPFVFAASCLTGDYEKGDDYNLAESLFDQGVANYIGATQVSPIELNTQISSWFYGHSWQWTNGEALGHAFAQMERSWYNESAYYDWYHFWVVEYNFYGDPKFGASEPAPMTLVAPAAVTAPTTTLQVEVPAYVVTTTVEGLDAVEIPGGKTLLAEGRHEVPYWTASVDYAPGYRVQDVDLTLRAGYAFTTGLNLPTAVITYYTEAPPTGGYPEALSFTEDDDWFPTQDEIYDWQVTQHPDGSSELEIRIYPFHYQPATTNAEWYDEFTFDIDVISTTVDIDAFWLNGTRFVPGDLVPADLWLENSGDPVDAIVVATVRDLLSGDTVAGLEQRSLHDLSGFSSHSLEWDSSGFAPGQYLLWVDLMDSEGNWLDSVSQMFRLGMATAEISSFAVTPSTFRPGDGIDISLAISNTGFVPLSGEAMIQVQTSDGVTTTAVFSHPVIDLAPGAEVVFNDVWDTTGAAEGDYRAFAYVKYEARTSEIERVSLTTRQRMYLPLILRSGP